MSAATKTDFNNIPTAYLQADASGATYTLYVSIELETGQRAVAAADPVVDVFGVLQHVELNIEDASGFTGLLPCHYETFEYVIPANTTPVSDEVIVTVTDLSGKKRKVIVHHADADVPD